MMGPDSTARYWSLLLLNLLGASEASVMEQVIEDDSLLDVIEKLLQPSQCETTSHAALDCIMTRGHPAAAFGQQNVTSREAASRSDEEAWAVSQRLDGALSRVQAAWLIANMCDTHGPEAGRKLVPTEHNVRGGVARGLMHLLAEAVSADVVAAESDKDLARYSVRIRGRRGALGDVDSEW